MFTAPTPQPSAPILREQPLFVSARQHLTRPIALSLVLGVLALVAALPAPAAAAPRPDFTGMVIDQLQWVDARTRAKLLDEQQRLGVGLVRVNFFWTALEPAPGVYNFDAYDGVVADAAARGITVLPMLIDAPKFRSTEPRGGGWARFYPPRHPGDMGDFAAKLVERYGPNGTFWRERPYAPERPIRAWQIWNEPNLPRLWGGRNERAGNYVRLLRAAATSIRRVDPGAEIVAAGIPHSRLSKFTLEAYLTSMYRSGGRPYFDTLAVHPYDRTYRGVLDKVKQTRRLMRRHGDGRKPIWITEYGWADRGPKSPYRAGPSGQGRQIKAALLAFARNRHRLRIRGTVLYNWTDGYLPGFDGWGLHTGLHRRNGARKPAYYAFRAAIRRLR